MLPQFKFINFSCWSTVKYLYARRSGKKCKDCLARGQSAGIKTEPKLQQAVWESKK